MSGIFVCYRSETAAAQAAGRLESDLKAAFANVPVFMDVDSVEPGEDWMEAIEAALSASDVVVAIIHPDWIGDERLADPDDVLRRELQYALDRQLLVVPVLVNGASSPRGGELPEALRVLARRQALPIRHASWRSDLGRLLTAIRGRLGSSHKESVPSAEVIVDVSHCQLGWNGYAVTLPEGLSAERNESDLLQNEWILDNCKVLEMALPYGNLNNRPRDCTHAGAPSWDSGALITDTLADHLRRWVADGNGLFLMGYYAADTHHRSNPSRLAREFGASFEDDLAMPVGLTNNDAQAQAFAVSEVFAVKSLSAQPATHQICEGVDLSDVAFLSSSSLNIAGLRNPELVLKAPDASERWTPTAPDLDKFGWRPKIDSWRKEIGSAPLLVAFSYGKGRVVMAGTWKISTLDYGHTAKLYRNILSWLAVPD